MTQPVSGVAAPGESRGPGAPTRRARAPDASGFAARDGVRIAWYAYGSGERSVLLLPTWPIVDARIWKAQVGYLARHFRVLTFDPRGAGGSDRPVFATDYTDDQYAADAVAVLDAAGVSRAVVAGFSCGVTFAIHLAAGWPERVVGLFAIAPSCGFQVAQPDGRPDPWEEPAGPAPHGWNTYNREFWTAGGYRRFVEFFFTQVFSEPHSTKQIEDCVGWALETGWRVAAASKDGRVGARGAVCPPVEPLVGKVVCPVLVLHGTEDRLDPMTGAERLVEMTHGDLLRLEGAGHGLPAREPVLVNSELRGFVDRVWPVAAPPRRWVRPLDRSPRVLYLSSPIGLGHARRDAAIAAALRRLRPEVRIDWLAQDPVTRVLEHRRERIHPGSAWLASESAHIEAESLDHDLHAFGAIRRMDEISIDNFMVFADVVAAEPYDLVVGDEAWEVDFFLHENPELKRFGYAWFTDFVGWLPMPDGGPHEAALTADYNAEMLEQRVRFPRLRDASIFVGDPDDLGTETFGPYLPEIRCWTEANFDFAGYVTGFAPVRAEDRQRLRAVHGYRDDERVCVVSVGGSGVGGALLRRVLDAVPVTRRVAPDLRFLIVTGPRIDPASLPPCPGVTVVGYLPDLLEHLIACDVAVVQGGLSTCMELTAARRPFVYVPLRHHFEQNLHVRRRLERYRAGRCLAYQDACDPDRLAGEVLGALDAEVDYLPVATDGALRAARRLADLF